MEGSKSGPGAPRRGPAPAALALVFLLALLPRLAGLDWGLPDPSHHFSFHPDEYNTLRVLAAMRPAELDFNPRYFHNPPLYYELCGLSYLALRGLGLMPPLDAAAFHQRPADVARFYRLGRLLSALSAALTAAVVYAAAADRAGFSPPLAAALVVLSPAHVVLGQVVDVDALLTLLVALALWLSMRLARAPSRATFLAGAAVVGLAAATKYNGLLAAVPLAAALAVAPAPARRRLGWAAAGSLLALLAFLAVNPYALLDHQGFRDGLDYVLRERVAGRWSGLQHGPLWALGHTWPWLVGEGGLVLVAAGVGAAAWRRLRADLPLLALAAAVYASVAATGTDYARYSLPALPALALLAGGIAGAAPRRRYPAVLGLAILVALLPAAGRTAALLGLMTGPDPRREASRFLVDRYPPGSRVGVTREPYFFSPPRLFMDYFYRGRSSAWRDPEGRFAVEVAADPAALARLQPDLVVLSEHELLYPVAPGSAASELLAVLLDGGRFREVARFDRPARLGPLLLEAPLPPPGAPYDPAAAARRRDRRLPHDLKYLNPAQLVLEPVRP